MNVFLIMCHKNISQVKRLISKCITANSRVVLHIDKFYELDEEEYEKLNGIPGLYLVDNRYHGILDDRSLVDIAMTMVDKAKEVEKKENIHFEYYLLLSGQDYLTKPVEYIENELKQMYPTPLIDCTPYDKSNWLYYKFYSNNKVRKYNKWINEKFPPRSLTRKAFRVSQILLRRIYQVCHKVDYYKARDNGIDIYGGSAWWILPDVVIQYIQEEYNANTRSVQVILDSGTPEEVFFQTMVMRSPLKNIVTINSKDAVEQNCKTWAYFFDKNKPFKGHPYIFTKQEYEKLINKDCWIARKFDTQVDEEILDSLDNYTKNFAV